MTLAINSITTHRFDRMSPTAAVLAVLLHVAMALALWWVSPLNHPDPEDEAIDVTIEQPAPPPPKPAPPPARPVAPLASPLPPPVKAAPKPPPQSGIRAPLGLPPPSPTTAETPQQAAPKGETPPMPAAPEEPKAATDPQQQPEPPAPPQQALVPQQPAPLPPTPLEQALPPLDAPPPPLTSQDFPKPAPPPPPPPPTPQQAHTVPVPPQQKLRPSPLSQPKDRPAPGNPQGSAPSATFVNPAQQASAAKITDQYIWQVVRQFSQYLPNLRERNEGGALTIRFVIARDGHLLDVSIARSSGVPALDKGMIEAVRAAAPYPPFPKELPGSQITYNLPIAAKNQ